MSALKPLSVAVASLALLAGLESGAAASECHYSCDGAYLGVTALFAGALALGAAALGTRFGAAAQQTRGDDEAASATSGVRDAHDAARPAQGEPAAPAGLRAEAVVDAGKKYAARLVAETGPRGKVVAKAFSVADPVVSSEDRAGALAAGAVSTAEETFKAAVQKGVEVRPAAAAAAESPPAASVATVPRYCRSCGTPTRERARFCSSCGRQL